MTTWRGMYATVVVLFLNGFLSNAAGNTIIELTSTNFEHQTQSATGQTTGKWFVKFYAPWCGHCQMLEPKWEELSSTVSQNHADDGIVVARIDASKYRDIGTRFGVKGFPTLIYFAERKMHFYKGARDVESLVKFVTEGYKTANGEDVPPAPTFSDKMQKKLSKVFDKAQQNDQARLLKEDFDHILDLRKNAAAVLLIIGAVIGFLFGCIFGSMRQRKIITKTKKD